MAAHIDENCILCGVASLRLMRRGWGRRQMGSKHHATVRSVVGSWYVLLRGGVATTLQAYKSTAPVFFTHLQQKPGFPESMWGHFQLLNAKRKKAKKPQQTLQTLLNTRNSPMGCSKMGHLGRNVSLRGCKHRINAWTLKLLGFFLTLILSRRDSDPRHGVIFTHNQEFCSFTQQSKICSPTVMLKCFNPSLGLQFRNVLLF